MPALELGSAMPNFTLGEPMTGRSLISADFPPQSPIVVAFVSNHCPHSQAWEGRLLQVARDYVSGVVTVMISSNDPEQIPECSPAAIAGRARDRDFPMPYLFDADQSVALAFGAERTPDVFVFDGHRRLVYHGAADDNAEEPTKVTATYLRDAVAAVLAGASVPIPETPLIGCGIKWVPGTAGSVEYVGKLAARGTWSDEQLATMLGYRGEAHLAECVAELTGQTLAEFRAGLK